MAGETYPGMEADYGVGQEVCILSISLFVAGLGVGPSKFQSSPDGRGSADVRTVFLGPASEFLGRGPVLHWSFAWFCRILQCLRLLSFALTRLLQC